MKSILITSLAAISTKLTMPTHQNELYTEVTKLTDWISTYDSSSLVSLGPIRENDNRTKWWLLRVTGRVSQSQDFQHWSCSLYKFQKTWLASFHTHINLGWLSNLRFDYSQTFGGFVWLHVVLTAPSMPSQGELIHSVLIPKSWLWEHKRSSIKFLYFLTQLSEE